MLCHVVTLLLPEFRTLTLGCSTRLRLRHGRRLPWSPVASSIHTPHPLHYMICYLSTGVGHWPSSSDTISQCFIIIIFPDWTRLTLWPGPRIISDVSITKYDITTTLWQDQAPLTTDLCLLCHVLRSTDNSPTHWPVYWHWHRAGTGSVSGVSWLYTLVTTRHCPLSRPLDTDHQQQWNLYHFTSFFTALPYLNCQELLTSAILFNRGLIKLTRTVSFPNKKHLCGNGVGQFISTPPYQTELGVEALEVVKRGK